MILIAGIGAFLSCENEEPDVFSASPAERLNSAIYNYRNILTDAGNGWEMDYFANSVSPGYTILVKFNKSGMATLASRSDITNQNAFEQDSCLFEIIGDQGPVLTFNTYSKILHAFSNPKNPDGFGLEGDYEFVVIKSNMDTLWLKGKKYGSAIFMRKMPDFVSWQQFINDRYEYASLLFSEKAPALTMKIDKATYTFSGGFSNVFNVKKSGINPNNFKIPFIVTKDGFRFNKVIEIEGKKFKTFKIDFTKGQFLSVENPELSLNGVEDLAVFFASDASALWDFVPTGFSPDFYLQYQTVVQSVKTLYSADDVVLSIKYSTIRRGFVLSLLYTSGVNSFEGLLDMEITSDNKDIIRIAFNGTGDAGGIYLHRQVQGMSDLLASLSSAFHLTTAAKVNPREILFTSERNPNIAFLLKVM